MPEITLSTAVRTGPDVLHRVLDGETVLLDVNRGVYYGLDAIGTRIWGMLVEGSGLAAVLTALLEEYEVAEEEARADLLRLVDELADQGLVELTDEVPGAEGP